MEKICSGNFENVLDLIEKASSYNIWVQTSEDDGFYDYVNRNHFENKMVDKINDNNCHIENFYLNEDGELYYEEGRGK